MKVRPGHAARSATQSQALSFAYFLTFPHLDFREMHINGEEVLSMIEHHAIAFIEKFARQHHCT